MPSTLTLYGGLAIGWLFSLLAAFAFGHTKGFSAADVQCAKADASANATAVTEWTKAAETQRKADADQRAADLKAQADSTAALSTLQDRWMAMKIGVIKQMPVGKCELSAPWVAAYNQGLPR